MSKFIHATTAMDTVAAHWNIVVICGKIPDVVATDEASIMSLPPKWVTKNIPPGSLSLS